MRWGQAQIDALLQSLPMEADTPTDTKQLIEKFTDSVGRVSNAQLERLKLLIQPHERRSDVRVAINLGLRIQEVLIDKYSVTLDIPMSVRAIDLSSGGIRLASIIQIPKTSFAFYFNLPLKDQQVKCAAEVMQWGCLDNVQLYGCRFINLDEADKGIIRNFVFSEQIRLRKKDARLYGEDE